MWKHHRPASHKGHLRLPLGVLNPSDTSPFTIFCTVCSRELASTVFPALGRNFTASAGCRAVVAKSNNNLRWGYELEEYFESIQEQDWDYYSPRPSPPLTGRDLDCLGHQ
jgi:hypothetical protein